MFLEDISILIGANASGKSNTIVGIEILSEIATGRDLVTCWMDQEILIALFEEEAKVAADSKALPLGWAA